MSPAKNPKSKTFQCFFNANYKTCRIVSGFEQLSSSIGRRVMELQNDGKKVAHVGLQGRSNLSPKVLNACW